MKPINVPGKGRIQRDASGNWELYSGSGHAPIPAEYRPFLDRMEALERQEKLARAAHFKASPLQPRLWDGPMPGDRNLTFCYGHSVTAGSGLSFKSWELAGNILIKSIQFQLNGSFVGGEQNVELWVRHNDQVVFKLESTLAAGMIDVVLIVPPGRVEFYVNNGCGSDYTVTVAANCWERIAPVLEG